jgi:hypothetical protein
MAAFIDITPVATNGNNAASSLLVRTQNVAMINHIRPVNANELASFPSAVSAVVCNTITQFQQNTVTVLTAQTVSALKTLIAA